MEKIKNLEDLEIGDWVKVYSKDVNMKHFKIGEIIDKWNEVNNPCFGLKIFETNLPLTTRQILRKAREKIFKKKIDENEIYKGKFDEEYNVLRLNEKERSTLLKKMILDKL